MAHFKLCSIKIVPYFIIKQSQDFIYVSTLSVYFAFQNNVFIMLRYRLNNLTMFSNVVLA